MLCCDYTLTDFPISIRLTSLALWQSNDCPSASKATLMHMDTYFMWIHYERLHNHNKAKHNKNMCIFLGIYCNHGHFDQLLSCAWSCWWRQNGSLELPVGLSLYQMNHWTQWSWTSFISNFSCPVWITAIDWFGWSSCYQSLDPTKLQDDWGVYTQGYQTLKHSFVMAITRKCSSSILQNAHQLFSLMTKW